jgi:hypothetical protein
MYPRPWTTHDVPPPPYYHGSRRTYAPGDLLVTDVVNNRPGEEDDRMVCFACIDIEVALDWAYSRGIGKGSVLHVYEIDMLDPEVDVNVHNRADYGSGHSITSVMSTQGTVRRVVRTVTLEDFDRTPFGKC